MKVNPHIFRGYDLRGLVDEDLSEELAEALGKAFGTYLKEKGIAQAVVGRDCRESGPAYSAALINGLSWSGINVTDIGMTLVGTFYWAQHHLDIQGGVYVSASHNPPQYNGFKFANDFSETLVSDGMQELRRRIEQDDFTQGEKPGDTTQKDIHEAYFKDLLGRLEVKPGITVVVDPSNTTAGALAPDLLRQAGCEVIEYNTKVDPTFPLGVADPTESKVVERLSQEVVEAQADIGFTYDADGDRIGIVDEKGGIIWNDVLVALFATDVLADHPGAKIMYNTLCSKVVPDTVKANGGEPFMWRTGHSFLKKKNQEVGAAFIGELSGHFFFSQDFYNHDDGLYSTLRLLQHLSRTGKKLSELVAKLPKYVSSPEIKLYCSDDEKISLVEKLVPVLKEKFPEATIATDQTVGDGLRMDEGGNMLVVRYSQNGPYLTIKFESKTQDQYEGLLNYVKVLLKKYPEIDWHSDISVNLEVFQG